MVLRALDRKGSLVIDWTLVILLVLLCLIGLCVLQSAGFNRDTGQSVQMKRQALAMGLGTLAFFVCMFIHGSFWRRWAFLFYVLGCGLLVGILFTGVVAGGARRWLDFGGFRMQPSEFMKIGVILALARVFSADESPRAGYTLLPLFWPAAVVLVPVGLIVVQPDLGTALSICLISGSMLLLVGIELRTFRRLALAALLALIPAWEMLHDYQRKRILNFLQPELDPQGSGYHAIQSQIAVGSGAMVGKGFMQGTQTQLRFLPEQTTDFLFSVLAEEWGFLGSAIVVALYTLLIVRLVTIASRAPDRFGAFVAFGVSAMIFWHVFVNIGMVIGIMPVAGITLPLLSYGGSSVVTVMAAIGIVNGILARRFLFA